MESNSLDKKNYPLLSQINSPKDIEKIDNVDALCEEIRNKIIEITSENGGHLSPNLGVVELTVALYLVFKPPEDKIIWDVGHQSYVHKMLTGRFKYINSIRKENGISGFTNRNESPYDIFTSGHSSTSISAALGVARSDEILKQNRHTIAVIGDGALTGGLAYEGLNNASKAKNFTVVLNDNKMSISKNVGAVARYLAAARIKPSYVKAKGFLEKVLEMTSVGLKIEDILKQSKSAVKNLIYKSSIFEDMGFVYYGPIDGHDIHQLKKVFELVKGMNQPTVVHVITNKGKGYHLAERDPRIFHAVTPFNPSIGFRSRKGCLSFSDIFGKKLCEIAKKDSRICAITAAMTSGTGLIKFKENFKSRFFDVGIAEGHAVTFASGLAAGGLIPVAAIYSSFLQRAYDQIIHDAALQNLKIILAVDRAGLIGEDGEAHQGVFDVSFLNTIPNVKIFSPSFFEELEIMLEKAVKSKEKCIMAIRYPRGGELEKPENYIFNSKDYEFYGSKESNILIVTYGRIFSEAYLCQQKLKSSSIEVCILKLNVIKPINEQALNYACKFENIVFFEEAVKSGGVGEKFGLLLLERKSFKGKYIVQAISDQFVAHASVRDQLKKFSLDSEGMEKILLDLIN